MDLSRGFAQHFLLRHRDSFPAGDLAIVEEFLDVVVGIPIAAQRAAGQDQTGDAFRMTQRELNGQAAPQRHADGRRPA